MTKYRIAFLILFVTSCSFIKGQDVDTLLTDDELTSADSLSIFRLIDSLLTLDKISASQLLVRISYNSNVLSAGRTLGIEQFGLAPGISYYHKSGLYADITTYWSNDFDPQFYLTTTSLGYMLVFNSHFSAMANYDHYFYNFGDEYYIPYSSSFSVSPFVDVGPITLRVDYSFYFGDDLAHRLMPGVSLNLKKKHFWGIDRISFNPGFYALFGDETISHINFVQPTSVAEAVRNVLKYGTRYSIEIQEKEVFGVMNYAISFPLTLSVKNWMFNFSYTYSIPKALDEEPLTLPETGYLSAGVFYTIHLNSKKAL